MSIESRKAAATDFLQRCATGDVREAYQRYVAELWDLGQAVPGDMVNEHGMF